MERLTLEDAINHAKKVADRKRWEVENTMPPSTDQMLNEFYKVDCLKCA